MGEEARKSEIYRQFFKEAADAIFVHAPDGTILEVNQTACDRLGYSHDELVGMSVKQIDSPEYREIFDQRVDHVADEPCQVFRTIHLARDGRQIPTELFSRQITLYGQPAVLTVARSLERSELMGDPLVLAGRLEQGICDEIPVGLWIADRQFTLLLWNRAMEDISGRPREEVLGENLFDAFPQLGGQGLADRFRKAMQTGQPFELRSWSTEDATLPKSGTHYFNITANPLRDRADQVTGLMVMIEDITPQRQSEMELAVAQMEQQRMADIIERSPMLVFRWGNQSDWPVDYVSGNITGLLGYEPEEFYSGKLRYAEIVHPDDFQRVHDEVQRHVAEGRNHYSQLYRLLDRDGQVHWMDDRTWVSRDENGQVSHFHGVMLDVTRRQAMADELKSANEQLTEINETLAATNEELRSEIDQRTQAEQQREQALQVAQRNSDELSALLRASRAVMDAEQFEQAARTIFDIAREITGATSGYVALLNEKKEENEVLFLEAGGRDCTVDPDLPMPIRGLRAEAYHDKKAVYDNDFHNSQWMDFMPDGHVRLDNVLFAPLTVANEVVGLLGIANKPGDFTDDDARIAAALGEMAAVALVNARHREDLLASEHRYRTLFESSDDAIFIMCETVIDCNDKALTMFGCTREEIIGRRPCDFSPPTLSDGRETQPLAEAYLKKALAGEPQLFQWKSMRSDGSLFDSEVQLKAITLDGQTCLLASVRDISERVEAQRQQRRFEARMQHTQKLESLGVLAGGIAHDFNNLLTSILGNSDLARLDAPEGSDLQRCIDEIQQGATRASELCNQLLAYSGKGRFVVSRVHMNEMIDELAHLLHTVISKKVNLQMDFQSDLPDVKGDASQLRQVMMNLITNASDALGDQPGTIQVTTRLIHATPADLSRSYFQSDLPAGAYVSIQVRDTGCGMDKTTCSRIFDPFFTTKQSGRGLGLAAVLGIVRSHHGTIRIDSAEGQGTTFEVLLPAAEPPAERPGDPDSEKPGVRVASQGKVLLVDDEPAIRQVTGRMLKRIGLEVVVAEDGLEAVEKLRQENGRISFVLLDMTMPRMDGWEAFQEMRKLSADLPVILMSGYDEKESIDRFKPGDLVGFLKKPFAFGQLEKLIRSASS
jgi:PAS domain S-box-containing protein